MCHDVAGLGIGWDGRGSSQKKVAKKHHKVVYVMFSGMIYDMNPFDRIGRYRHTGS